MKSIGISTGHPKFSVGQQVDYIYNSNNEAFKLLAGYGFAVDNNPHAQTTIRMPNHLLSMRDDQVLTCQVIGCLDPYYEGTQSDKFYEGLNEGKRQNV